MCVGFVDSLNFREGRAVGDGSSVEFGFFYCRRRMKRVWDRVVEFLVFNEFRI